MANVNIGYGRILATVVRSRKGGQGGPAPSRFIKLDGLEMALLFYLTLKIFLLSGKAVTPKLIDKLREANQF